MKQISLYLFLTLLGFVVSCSQDSSDVKTGQNVHLANGGKVYGGEISFYVNERVSTFFPLSSISMYNQRAVAPVFETLLQYNEENGNLQGHLISSYDISNENRFIDLTVRKGVYFHDDPCFNGKKELLTAEDIKFTLEMACSSHALNQHAHLLLGKIKGAREFYDSYSETHESELSGVEVLSDHKLRITLLENSPTFLKILTHQNLAVFSKKAFMFYRDDIEKHPIGTGPFKLKTFNEKELVYEKNENYWQKDEFNNRLPFLNGIHVLFNSAQNEFEAFTSQKTDLLLSIPSNQINSLFGTLDEAKMGKNILHKLQIRKGVMVNYIAFDCSTPPFDDLNLRRAILHGIDRNRICEEVLLGEGTPAESGLLPEVYFKQEGRENRLYNKTLARSFMNKSRYSGQELDFFANFKEETMEEEWCMELIRQLKENIGLNLRLISGSYKQKVEAIDQGKVKIWKGGYVPDYPDAESFLNPYYSKSNTENVLWARLNYVNEDFNRAFEESFRSFEEEKRNAIFKACNKILTKDAPVVPINFENLLVVYNLNLRDANMNSFGIIDFSRAYYKPIE